jgi:hypothetical protein
MFGFGNKLVDKNYIIFNLEFDLIFINLIPFNIKMKHLVLVIHYFDESNPKTISFNNNMKIRKTN